MCRGFTIILFFFFKKEENSWANTYGRGQFPANSDDFLQLRGNFLFLYYRFYYTEEKKKPRRNFNHELNKAGKVTGSLFFLERRRGKKHKQAQYPKSSLMPLSPPAPPAPLSGLIKAALHLALTLKRRRRLLCERDEGGCSSQWTHQSKVQWGWGGGIQSRTCFRLQLWEKKQDEEKKKKLTSDCVSLNFNIRLSIACSPISACRRAPFLDPFLLFILLSLFSRSMKGENPDLVRKRR